MWGRICTLWLAGCLLPKLNGETSPISVKATKISEERDNPVFSYFMLASFSGEGVSLLLELLPLPPSLPPPPLLLMTGQTLTI